MSTPAFDGPLGPTLIEIIRGTPTAEEIAALTALLTTLAAASAPEPGPVPAAAGWDRPERFPPASWRARP
ncbi:acyl-CoA carboxylase epsilon subunit [Streptomyces sp. G-G2]|uniref:acyl-CoA carboxylase epsilon subunit n=1 Tax=Streptomyces sp. G-G2 TaxID=3046201 RepID=UPI0024BA4409|nr:acyl-CoA carboxylase epsilon subunit [Streptomyces sp. G-G2]MDJ0382259.1 acyl-CoA carboxylase epsilon subunit [Streptomyces sp. G-G2]